MNTLTSSDELAEFMTLLHDCPFDLNDSSYDSGQRCWTGTFLRPLWDGPSARHRGVPVIFERSDLPVSRVVLRLREVDGVEVKDRAQIGVFTFNSLETVSGGLRLLFDPDLELTIGTTSVEAEYEEEPVIGLRARYTQVLLVQSGPKLVREEGAS